MDALTVCKLASYASEMHYSNLNDLLVKVNRSYAYYLSSSGWRKSPGEVKFIKVYHIETNYLKSELYNSLGGTFISDTNAKRVTIIDRFLLNKFGVEILQSDSALLVQFKNLHEYNEYIITDYIYMHIEGEAPVLISKNGIRNQLNYYSNNFIKLYYNGIYFDDSLINTEGKLIVNEMRRNNLLIGYPVVFPDIFKKFFTIDNKPTQLFLPDTCFPKNNWERAWRYKPDY